MARDCRFFELAERVALAVFVGLVVALVLALEAEVLGELAPGPAARERAWVALLAAVPARDLVPDRKLVLIDPFFYFLFLHLNYNPINKNAKERTSIVMSSDSG
jgi:hypothetical protein